MSYITVFFSEKWVNRNRKVRISCNTFKKWVFQQLHINMARRHGNTPDIASIEKLSVTSKTRSRKVVDSYRNPIEVRDISKSKVEVSSVRTFKVTDWCDNYGNDARRVSAPVCSIHIMLLKKFIWRILLLAIRWQYCKEHNSADKCLV